ncbi:MAG: DUF2892 domain-containing protein [Lautropia sp.]
MSRLLQALESCGYLCLAASILPAARLTELPSWRSPCDDVQNYFSLPANRFALHGPLCSRGMSSHTTGPKEIAMFYVKNVPTWERILRVVMGVMGLAFAVMNWGSSGWAVGIGVMAAMLAMTGLFGFCPMCAMVGRKLDKKH